MSKTIDCPECNGRGEILVEVIDDQPVFDECPACRGLGVVDGTLITDQVEPLTEEEEEIALQCGCLR